MFYSIFFFFSANHPHSYFSLSLSISHYLTAILIWVNVFILWFFIFVNAHHITCAARVHHSVYCGSVLIVCGKRFKITLEIMVTVVAVVVAHYCVQYCGHTVNCSCCVSFKMQMNLRREKDKNSK